MAVTSAEEFFAVLEKSKLLDAEQLAAARSFDHPGDSPRAVAKSLARQNLITRWQAGQLLAGRSSFHLGKYRLIELLGHGRMGNVFLGEHTAMNRRVALKIIPRQIGNDPALLAQFLAEFRPIAALDHPNLVHVYNVDNEGNRYYLVMEYVEGVDLQRLVANGGPLSCDRVVDYICQTADGLDYVHQQNMIHGDIKPSNLQVNLQGVVKILDLGLTRLAEDNEPERSDPDDGSSASVDYLAPEQTVNSPNLDNRADIYSLGCVLYFLLAGHPPFPHGTPSERILKHQTRPPPDLHAKRSEVPANLAALCRKMMAKKPEDRYPTAAEASLAVAQWQASYSRLKRAIPLPIAKRLEEP